MASGSSSTDEMSVSEIFFWKHLQYVPLILHNYRKGKRAKIVIFKSSFFLSAQHILVTIAE